MRLNSRDFTVRESLTNKAHQWLKTRIQQGQHVIDATAGNGYDTVFLARLVGTKGKVYAFDIQEQAIANTHRRLQEEGIQQVELFQCCHSKMQTSLPASTLGFINGVMFNLGYLPRADKTIITRSVTTLSALQQLTAIVANPAYITIIAYPGHTGGKEEQREIEHWLNGQHFSIETVESETPTDISPKLYLIKSRT